MTKVLVPLIFPLLQRPEWRGDPHAITFLMTTRDELVATKQWLRGKEQPINYARTRYWRPYVARANGIESLSSVLIRAAKIPRLTAVRGAIRETSVHLAVVNRRVHQYPGETSPCIEDVPRHWLMIDLDSLPEPSDFDWKREPRRAAIWAARHYLPLAFREHAFHFHYSGSAGMKPGLRLHFWFWLERPLGSSEAKQYLQCVGGGKVDLSLYNPVQPHYTADPVFVGLQDPIANERGGLVLESDE